MKRQRQFAEILSQMERLFVKKDSAYGGSYTKNFERFGLSYPLTRMYEKLDRLTTLSKGASDNGESIEDNLLDIANIAVLALIELDNKKEKLSKSAEEESKKEEHKEKPKEEPKEKKSSFDSIIKKVKAIDIDNINLEEAITKNKYVFLAIKKYKDTPKELPIIEEVKFITQIMVFVEDNKYDVSDECILRLLTEAKKTEEKIKEKMLIHLLGGK